MMLIDALNYSAPKTKAVLSLLSSLGVAARRCCSSPTA
jgi:hypothetical protein